MPTIYLDVLLLQSLYVNYFFAACCGKTDAYAFALDTVRTGSGGEQPVFPVDPAAALAGMVSAGV